MKRFILGALALLAASLLSGPALAQGNSCSGGAISGMVIGGTTASGACYYIKVNSDGSINANATVTPGGTQDVNITQTGGVTQLRGAGAVGTGSERIAVGQDVTTIAGAAPGTAGTPSANVVSVQGVSGGVGLTVSEALVTITDRSKVNAASSNTLAAANASRITLSMQNVDATINQCYSFTGSAVCGAAGTYILYPGQVAFWPAGSAPRTAVTTVAASGTPVISAYEGQ